jgi:hypothetical protein
MGYRVDWRHCDITISPALNEKQQEYLKRLLCNPGHDSHLSEAARALPDPLRVAVGLPFGREGEFFTGGPNEWYGTTPEDNHHFGRQGQMSAEEKRLYTIPYNEWTAKDESPYKGGGDFRPSRWFPWEIGTDHSGRHSTLVPSEGEKQYVRDQQNWLTYLTKHIFEPWGKTLTGRAHYSCDESGIGFIEVAPITGQAAAAAGSSAQAAFCQAAGSSAQRLAPSHRMHAGIPGAQVHPSIAYFQSQIDEILGAAFRGARAGRPLSVLAAPASIAYALSPAAQSRRQFYDFLASLNRLKESNGPAATAHALHDDRDVLTIIFHFNRQRTSHTIKDVHVRDNHCSRCHERFERGEDECTRGRCRDRDDY